MAEVTILVGDDEPAVTSTVQAYLLGNALQYTLPGGRVTVRAQLAGPAL